jgi:hypothetical protein
MFFHIDPDSKLGKGVLILGLPLFALFLWFEVRGIYRSHRCREWPTAPGVILESKVERKHDVHGIPSSSPRITYQYTVGLQQFENNTINFALAGGAMTWGFADRKVEEFPKGKLVDVLYDPNHPEKSCLETGGLGWEDYFLLVVAVSGICFGIKMFGAFLRWLIGSPKLAAVN